MTDLSEDELLDMLNLTDEDLGRLRYVSLSDDGTKIELCSRIGDGNREEYQYVFDKVIKHPNYLKNYDEKNDSTYARIVFSVPKQHLERTMEAVKDELLEMLNLTIKDIGKFENAYLSDDGTGIIVYTKIGGWRENDFYKEFKKLRKNPNYIKDFSTFPDSTHVTFVFSVPEQYLEKTKEMVNES